MTKRQPCKTYLLATKRRVRDRLTCAPWSLRQNNTAPLLRAPGSFCLPAHLPSCAHSEQDKQRDSVSIPASPHLALVIIEPGAWSRGFPPKKQISSLSQTPGRKGSKTPGNCHGTSLSQRWILRARHTVACVPAIQSSSRVARPPPFLCIKDLRVGRDYRPRALNRYPRGLLWPRPQSFPLLFPPMIPSPPPSPVSPYGCRKKRERERGWVRLLGTL